MKTFSQLLPTGQNLELGSRKGQGAKGSGSWARQAYCVFIRWPLPVQRLHWTPGRACPAKGDIHASLSITQGADLRHGLSSWAHGNIRYQKGVERLDGADQSWVQLNSEDFMEDANVEQTTPLRGQGLGSGGSAQ